MRKPAGRNNADRPYPITMQEYHENAKRREQETRKPFRARYISSGAPNNHFRVSFLRL
jgi:hypothetical protein